MRNLRQNPGAIRWLRVAALLTVMLLLPLVGARPPARALTNDNRVNAVEITSSPYVHTVMTSAFTTEASDPALVDCGPANVPKQTHSAWYRFTPAGSGQLAANTYGSDYDTVLAVFAATTPLTQLACNDDAIPSLQSAVSVALTVGQSYLIEVMASGNQNGGNMTLTITYTGAVTSAVALAFDAQPSATLTASTITPAPSVVLRDANGATVTHDSTTVVTLALQLPGSPSPAPKLTCTGGLTRTAQAGVAAFDGCSVDRAIAGATLRATSGSLTAATSIPFTISNPQPVVTSLSPSGVLAGSSAFTLTVTGSAFMPGATVQVGATGPITPASITDTTLTLTVPAAAVSQAGDRPVVVTNVAPGGGSSAPTSFTVSNPSPTIASVSPAGAIAGSGAFTLTINGEGFVSSSIVNFGDKTIVPATKTATKLTAAIAASDIAQTGEFPVTVTNPGPGGGGSQTFTFAVTNPTPTISSLSSSTKPVGSAGFILTINGSKFLPQSTVLFGALGSRVPTTVTPSAITIALTTLELATAATYDITVLNPEPGGGQSNSVSFAVVNPSPLLSSLSPAQWLTTGGELTLTINGQGFVATSVVEFEGAQLAIATVTPTKLTVVVPGAMTGTPGPRSVKVTNASPGGGPSNTLSLPVLLPKPVIASLSPSVLTARQDAVDDAVVEINGSAFLPNSVARWNGSSRPTEHVSATLLRVTVPAADLTILGSVQVSVFNPGQSDLSNSLPLLVRSRADANCDGTLALSDALFILKIIAGASPVPGCDANADGIGPANPDANDALYVLRVLAGLVIVP
ncbi:hypothetical protein AYO38_02210 [bacterium SCGC AG-212-C10]|nr:hypothetical protein AYO38_02210 [bacterium SCGC AG-212-C10]